MKLKLSLLASFFIVTASLSAQDKSPYQVNEETINGLPTFPQGKPSGLDAFNKKKSKSEDKKEDFIKILDLQTQGNTDTAMAAGVSVKTSQKSKNHVQTKRPRIGLVLSGGGARGGAHLGVIKAFEAHNIPIDAIVGTSMGSFIGGLYASGMSSGEIERMLTTMDWSKVITVDYDRQNIPFRRKNLQRAFPGNAKVGINDDGDVVFGTGLFKRQTMLQFLRKKTLNVSNVKHFDQLRIPFRSVASRLEDGETIVLRDGSLAESIYASIAIPGGFDPITINGEVLVDGGVADNLPLDVMRKEMNVDYIVVVDISTPYDDHAKFDNYISVMGQLINILMRKNVEQTIMTMKGHENEVLITPDLEGYTPLDADKYPEIIKIGLDTTQKAYGENLAHLSLYEEDYYQYLAERPKVKKFEAPVIDRIEVQNPTYIANTAILDKIHVKVGEKLDVEELNQDLIDVYDMMIFDDVTYKIKQIGGENVLTIITTPSWDVNGQIKFAFGFEDNFNGHSDYFVKLEYTKYGLNAYGGEWRNRVSFGQENLLLTELYQPIDANGHFYIRPVLYYRNKKVYVTPKILDSNYIDVALDKTFVLQARDYGGILGLGVNINKDLRVEAVGDVRHVNPSTDVLAYNPGATQPYQYINFTADADVYDVGGELEFDNLNRAFFPSEGHRTTVRYHYSNQYKGIEPLTYNQLFIDYAGAFSYGKSTIEPHFKIGKTFGINDFGRGNGFTDSQDFSSYYTLGGLFNLSGLPRNAVTGNNMGFASLVYRYRLTDDNFFGSLGMPIYAGASIESGGVYYGEDKLKADELLYSESVYVGADTILGPFYLGLGTTQDPAHQQNYYSFHLSLGQAF